MISLLRRRRKQAEAVGGLDRRRGRPQGDRRQGEEPRRHDHGGVLRHLCHDRRAARLFRPAGPRRFGRPGEPRDRLAARHRRPQRRGAGHRHQDRLAVCRAAPHRRRRRGDREALDRAARHRGRADLSQAEERRGLRLAEAPADARSSRTTSSSSACRASASAPRSAASIRPAPTASHIVGLTNIDNQGISGLEKYIDDQGLADLQASGLAVAKDLKPVKLSIDLRVQHIVHDELAQAHGALPRHRRRRRRAQRQDRRGRGDGVAARLRSEQPLQCA